VGVTDVLTQFRLASIALLSRFLNNSFSPDQ
jgi:hypothetical protein